MPRERLMVIDATAEEAGRVDAAAQRLGISRSTLYQKIKTYGMQAARVR